MNNSETTILLVEDNPGDRRLIAEMLAGTAFASAKLINAGSFAEALTMTEHERDVILVLLDLNLPDSRGMHTLRSARLHFPLSALLVLTGIDDERMANEAVEAGAHNYVTKDELNPRLLERMIRYSIERQKILIDLETSNKNLRDSQYLLDKAQEAGHIGFWAFDLGESGTVFWSPECRRIFGLSEKAPLSNSDDFFKIVYPDDLDRVRRASEVAIETLRPLDIIHRIIRPDGALRWVHSVARATVNDDGSLHQLVGMVQDITEQREAAIYTEQREQLFNLVAQNASDIIVIYDESGHITYVSEAVTKVLGYTTQELHGAHISFFLHPEESSMILDRIDRMIEEKKFSGSFTVRARQADGDYVWVESTLRPVEPQTTDRCYISITRDVTERRVAEEQIRLFSRAVDQSADMIFLCSMNHNIIYANNASEKVLGYARTHLMGESILSLTARKDQQLIDKALRQTIVQGSYQTEIDIQRADNTMLPVDLNLSTILNDQGIVSGIMCILHDITERKQVENQLREFNRVLEDRVDERTQELNVALAKEKELSELKTRFMSMVSHEFRTPLTVILSSSELVHRYYDRLNAEQRDDHFKTIEREVSHLVTMLNDVLTLGKSAAAKVNYNPTEIQLKVFLHNLLSKSHTLDHDAHHINLRNEWPSETVRLDENLIMHVCTNLIENAIKYSAQGSEIDVHVEECAGEFALHVRDHGIGIPDDDIPLLFDAFHRAANVSTIQGTGLGLAIVSEYVKLHGGRIIVQSRVGEGSTFSIYLPQ